MPTCDDRIGELFPNDPRDWRDPGDDVARASHLVALALISITGLGLAVGSLVAAVLAHNLGSLFLLVVGVGMGLLLLCGNGGFLLHEARRVDWRTMTADRMVAGGFLTGVGTGLAGLVMLRAAPAASRSGIADSVLIFGLFALGAAIFLATLGVGLGYAFAGGRRTNRTIAVRRVLARYGVASEGESSLEHPDPAEDGMQGWVSFCGTDGRRYELRASPAAYAVAYDAAGGEVRVERGTIVAIHPALAVR